MPLLSDLAEILVWFWGIVWLYVIQILLGSDAVQLRYDTKTGKNLQFFMTFVSFWFIACPQLSNCNCNRACKQHIMDVKFQCLARGLWYLVLVPNIYLL